jgi:hypothetical protein
MTEDDAKKRIARIEAMQARFDNKLASLDKDLLGELLSSADTILANPKTLSRVLGTFEANYHIPVLQQFGVDLLTIKSLNDAYFEGAIGETMGGQLVNQALFENVQRSVEKLMVDQFGITAQGDIVSNGLFDLFSKDTTVRREIQQFAYGQKASGIGLEKFKKNLRRFVEGVPGNPDAPAKGVWKRHYDTVAYDTYQQADRIAQQSFAEGLNMSAFLYLGGTIAGTRLFCRLRDGKVFLRSEIDKMGTPADTYGGYTNKATGAFAGKTPNYNAFISAGGFFCRHHWSALSDREALRRRPELTKAFPSGKLGIRQQQPVQQPQQKATNEAELAKKADLKQKTVEVTKLTYFKDYQAAVKRLNYKKHVPQLTLNQAAIVNGYTTQDFYFQLNRYLRTKATSGARLDQYDAVQTVLNDALEKMPTAPGLVYRGTNLTPTDIDGYLQAFKTKSAYIEKGFLSTTTDYGKKFRGNVEFFIKQKSGRFVDPISDSKGELEVLLPTDRAFKVTRVDDVGGIIEIDLEEL